MISALAAQKPRHLQAGRRSRSAGLWVFPILAFLLMTGCVSLTDPETSQIHEQDVVATLEASGTAAGQTFISRRPGLDSLTLWLGSKDRAPQGSLIFELFHSPAETTPLYRTDLPTGNLNAKKTIQITFPAQNDPPGQMYYFRLRAEGKNLEVYGRLENIYSAGAFLAEAPLEADLAFRTTYTYGWHAWQEDLLRWGRNAWLVIPLVLLLLVPGWLLLDLAGGWRKKDLGSNIALAVGTSMAFVPVLMLWTTTLKLSWSSSSVWIALGLLLVIQVGRHWKYLGLLFKSLLPSQTGFALPGLRRNAQNRKHSFALLGIFIIALITRLIMVRDFAAPLWVDSVHHGLITRLILAQGSFPASFSPYLNILPAEYHPGFHSLAASFIWLSGLEINQALLVLGQVLNALSVFSTYLFTVTLLKDRSAGLIAAALTGFFTPMPAYYTSWGRYTHLAGMLVLPVFLALFIQVLNQPTTAPLHPAQGLLLKRVSWRGVRSSLVLCLVAAGLFLLHYRIAAFGLLLAIAFIIFQPQPKRAAWSRKWVRSALAALITFLLVAPWILPFIDQILLPQLATTGTRQPIFNGFAWQYLTSGLGTVTLFLALFGLVLGISLRKKFAFILLLWVSLLFLLPNLSSFGLPGGYLVNHTAVEISLYLPISVLGGFAVSFVVRASKQFLPTRWRVYAQWGFSSLALILVLIGAQKIIPILNPVTFLARQPDIAAATWIAENLPEDGTIAINPFLWGYGFYAGSDGGFWLAPLTGHPTLPPPVLYGVSPPEEITRINQFCEQTIAKGKDAQGLWELLQQYGIRYVFLGARGGAISPRALEESEQFRRLYAQDGAWVYEVVPQNQNPCSFP